MDSEIKYRSDKKINVPNPFFFHALRSWAINPTQDTFSFSNYFLMSPEDKSKLVESVVGDHLCRASYNRSPTDTYDPSSHVFYVKSKKGKELDFLVRYGGDFLAFDLTYQNKLNGEDFTALRKFKIGCMISKHDFEQKENIAVIPVSLLLMYI